MKIIITGASRGIGRGIATVLAREGMHVGLTARSSDALRALRDELSSSKGACVVRPCDLRNHADVEAAVAELVDALGGVDGLINNAGVVLRKSIFELTVLEFREMVETNLCGVFHVTRAVAPILRNQGHGHIINIASISGRNPLQGGSGYAATKYAVTGFSQSLFLELREYGIKVTTIYPGSVDSASHRHDPTADHSWKVTPEEVGKACLDVLRTAPGTVVSELEIRPLARPPKA